jgi:hypothetical protein
MTPSPTGQTVRSRFLRRQRQTLLRDLARVDGQITQTQERLAWLAERIATLTRRRRPAA